MSSAFARAVEATTGLTRDEFVALALDCLDQAGLPLSAQTNIESFLRMQGLLLT